MSGKPRIGWGVVGIGWVTRDYVVPAIGSAANAELVRVCDRRVEAVAEYPAEARATLEELLADDDVDAVYVATPNDAHEAIAVAALEVGKPVLCEKPLAATRAAAERMAAASERTGTLLATAYDQRFHPAHQSLRSLVRAGALGSVTQARIHYACWLPSDWADDNWRIDPARAGGGAGIDLAPHGVDLLATLLDAEPVRMTAALQSGTQNYASGADDGAVVLVEFDAFDAGSGRVLATIHVGYNCRDELPRRRLELVGTRGMVLAENTMGQTAGGSVTLFDAAGERLPQELPEPERSPFAGQIEAFSEAVRLGRPFEFPVAADVRRLGMLLDARDEAAGRLETIPKDEDR